MKLYKKVECKGCNAGYVEERIPTGETVFGVKSVIGENVPCKTCSGLGFVYVELIPAELAALNLKAMAVLRELRAWIVNEKELLGIHPHDGALYQEIRDMIADLEAKFPDEQVQDTLVDAEAFRLAVNEGLMDGALLEGYRPTARRNIEARTDVCPSGRAELAGKGEEKNESDTN